VRKVLLRARTFNNLKNGLLKCMVEAILWSHTSLSLSNLPVSRRVHIAYKLGI